MIEYLILISILIIMYYVSLWDRGREGFSGKTETITDFYDSVYAEVYNALWHSSKTVNEFEQVTIQEALLAGKQKGSLKILDIACGTGFHACLFKKLGVDYTGLDSSEAMLSQARKACPNQKFQKGDATVATTYGQKSFSGALLLGFAIYELNPKIILDNAFAWIEPGGSMLVHVVDPDKFDPLLDLASPFAAFSLQKYSYERQTKSEIYFDDFKYTGEFHKKLNEPDATFSEMFTFFNPADVKYREQVHKWNMPSLESMIEIIKSAGFRVSEKIDLVSVGKEYQYLFLLTK
uniref:Methyltransferase domain-containing protein n=1 Tax=viral metagenome TaxID=1070528 RepID=A0A6C0HEX8_9ZZZZ